MKKFFALILILSLLTGQVLAAEPILPEREHLEMSFQQLEELHFDEDDFRDACEALTAAAERGDRGECSRLLEEVRQQYLVLQTEYEVAYVHTTLDVTDEAEASRYTQLLLRVYDVDEQMGQVIPAVLDSDCGDLVDRRDMVLCQFLEPVDGLTDEEEANYTREQELIDAYFDAAYESYSVELGGHVYDETELYDAWLDGTLSDQDYDEGSREIQRQQNAALGGYYVDLVALRKEQAGWYDYDDFAQFCDENTYYRDYTPTEIQRLREAVKRDIVPVEHMLTEQIYAYNDQGKYHADFTVPELLENLRTGVERVSPELVPALRYMERNQLYDIDYSDVKEDVGYTLPMPYSGGACLIMLPYLNGYDGDLDLTTLFHEFGHFNAYYAAEDLFASNLDLAEIHSQGLELLMLEEYETFYGDCAEAEQIYTVCNLLDSLIQGCMIDELERWAYSQENLTVEGMNREYMTLLKAYGCRDPEDPETMAYDWVTIPHMFESPLYYLSYAVSAAGAFSIWEQSLTDRPGAIDTYLRLVALGEGDDFFRTLRQVEIENPISPAHMEMLADTVAEWAGETSGSVGLWMLAGLGLVILLAVLILILVRKRRKRHDKAGDRVYAGTAGAAYGGGAGYGSWGTPAPGAEPDPWGTPGGEAAAWPRTDDPSVWTPPGEGPSGPER